MEKVLSQEEIDAMVRSARGAPGETGGEQRSIKPCTFQQSGQLAVEQVRAISGLLETFARSLGQSLGAYLGVTFEARLASVEQLAYGEFLERIPQITYMMSFIVSPMNVSGALQLDNSLVFPLVDILLGGTGQCGDTAREVSEIEEQVIHGVAAIVCRDLSAGLGPLGINLDLEKRQSPAQMQRFRIPTERMLCVSLEIKLLEVQGTLNLAFPAAVSNPMLRKLCSGTAVADSPAATTAASLRLREKMLDCIFPALLELTGIDLSVQEVLALSPGDVHTFGIPAGKPASFLLAGREIFAAMPIRQGSRRAAQIGEPIAVLEEKKA